MSKLKALLLTIRNETTPIASHTDPLALNDVWREVFEIIEAVEHSVEPTCSTCGGKLVAGKCLNLNCVAFV